MKRLTICLSAFLLAGCTAGPVTTYKSTESNQGVVYALPRTILELNVVITETVVTDKPSTFGIALTVTPHHVADPKQQFVLRRKGNWFFDDAINFHVASSGMLSSIGAISTDQTLTTAKSVLEAGIGILKLQALGGIGGIAQFVDTAPEATPTDQAAALLDIALAEQLRPLVGTHRRYWSLPAAGGLRATFSSFPAAGWDLEVALVAADKIGPPGTTSGRLASADPIVAPTTPASGILTRGLEQYVAIADLKWQQAAAATPPLAFMKKALEAERAAEAQDAKDAREQAKAKFDTFTPPLKDAGKAAERELAAAKVTEAHAIRDNQPANITAEFRKTRGLIHQALKENTAQRGFAAAGTNYMRDRHIHVEQKVLVADYAPITRLPLSRALFVKSSEDVTLSDGVVTMHKWNRPSSAAALAAFPVEVIERLLEVPAEIIQLKINTMGDQIKLLKKIGELEAQLASAETTQTEDENAYLSALATAINKKKDLNELPDNTPQSQRQTTRAAFVTAAITANAAARKVGKSPPFPEIERL